MCKIRLCAAALALAVACILHGNSTACAGWIVFPVVSAPGSPPETALVAEQIFRVPGGGGLLDYEFLVANRGPDPIDGFFLGVGKVAAALVGGGGTLPPADQWFASANDPANGPFPALVAGGAINTPLAVPFWAGPTNPFSPALFQFWHFTQFDDSKVLGVLPTNYYVVGWGTGYDPTGAVQRALPPLLPGFYTRFDLFSFFGPVPGTGGIDPLSGAEIGIEDIQPNGSPFLDFGTETMTTGLTVSDTSSPIPIDFSGFTPFGLPVPEPSTFLTLAIGLLGVVGYTWRRVPVRSVVVALWHRSVNK